MQNPFVNEESVVPMLEPKMPSLAETGLIAPRGDGALGAPPLNATVGRTNR